MPQEDLWGDLPKVEKLRTPLVILKEQAELISDKTEGLLVGEISQQQQSADAFQYLFKLIAPTLNNYSYSVLSIKHNIGFYPLNILDMQGGERWLVCSDENDYKEHLRIIFTAEKTQAVVSKLLTHIGSV